MWRCVVINGSTVIGGDVLYMVQDRDWWICVLNVAGPCLVDMRCN